MNRINTIESLRGIAALYVLFSHIGIVFFRKTNNLSFLFSFGQEAVMLFFIISGFVIMYSMERSPDKSFSTYIERRFFRIYPIFIFALAISYLFSGTDQIDIKNFIGNIFMLQDFSLVKPGVVIDTFSGNNPLWSLSYEWWFYILFFPTYIFIPEKIQLLIVTIISVLSLILYNHFYLQPFLFTAYFPLWWSGAEIGRAIRRKQPIPFLPILAALSAVGITCAFYAGQAYITTGELSVGHHPFLELRHVAAVMAMVIALFIGRRPLIARSFERLVARFAAVAPISYGLYALHYPVILFAARASGPIPLKLTLAVAGAFSLAWFAEVPYQQWAQRLRRRRG